VPESALIRRGPLVFVFIAIAGADDVARLRAITIGDITDGRVELLDGVVAGERVITSPPHELTDGTRISAVASNREVPR
jgi:multidrug efflux pump subunit AcrA (membrane-fusion protein)